MIKEGGKREGRGMMDHLSLRSFFDFIFIFIFIKKVLWNEKVIFISGTVVLHCPRALVRLKVTIG